MQKEFWIVLALFFLFFAVQAYFDPADVQPDGISTGER